VIITLLVEMKTENKYTKHLIANRVLKAVKVSMVPNKPVLRFPQDKFNSSNFFSVYQNTKEKSRGRRFRWQIGPLQAEGGSYFTHGDGGAPGLWVWNGLTLPACTRFCW
jgi:hypothetical protein